LDDHATFLQRLLIIPAVLLVSFVLAPRSGSNITRLIVALPFLYLAMTTLSRWPALGLIGLVVASISFQQEIVHVLGLTTLLTLGLAGLWLLDMIVRQGRIEILPLRPFLPFFLLIVIGLLSIGTAQFPYFPVSPAPIDAQFGGLLIIVVAFLVFLLAAHQITSVAWLKWLTFVFVGIGGSYLILRYIPGTGRLQSQLISWQVLNNTMFWCWLAAMAFSQGLFNKQLAPYWRGTLIVVALAVLFKTYTDTTDWVSGWLPASVALVAIVWIARPRLAYVLTLVGGFVVATQMTAILENLIYVGDNVYSETTRLEAWRIIFEITSVNPLLGTGFANYSFYTPLFPILGWYVQFNSHNNYVDIIAQTGILGLLCLLWLYAEIGRVGWRLYLMVRDEDDWFVRAYVYGVLGGFVATVMSGMLGDWVLPYVYNITIRGMRASMLPWLFLGGLLAIEQILIRQRVKHAKQDRVAA